MFISDEIWKKEQFTSEKRQFFSTTRILRVLCFNIKSIAFKVGYTNLKQIRFNKILLEQKSRKLCNFLRLENYFPEISQRIASILTGARNFSRIPNVDDVYLRTHQLWFSTIKHMTAIVFCDVQHFSMSWSDETILDEKNISPSGQLKYVPLLTAPFGSFQMHNCQIH